MFLSLQLLYRFFPHLQTISLKDLTTYLNRIGVETENVYQFSSITNLKVGLIQKVSPHPNADRLKVCKVLVQNQTHQIVCGANNVAVGLKSIVALAKAQLPNGLIIQNRKIRNVDSNGMLCAYNELVPQWDFIPSFGDKEIVELDSDADLETTNPLALIGLDDTILELSIPFNRPDLYSVFGIGFDLTFLYFSQCKITFDFAFNKKKAQLNCQTKQQWCRFFGCVWFQPKTTTIGWVLKKYLLNSGISISDFATNICNLNTLISGVPTFCFAKRVNSQRFMVGLNSQPLNLKQGIIPANNTLVVCDQNQPLALPFYTSFTTPTPQTLMFAIGCFHPSYLHKNAQNNIKSLALFKKQSLWWSIKAFDFLLALIAPNAKKPLAFGYTSFVLTQRKIKLSYRKMAGYLGGISALKMQQYVAMLNWPIDRYNNCQPPVYRNDLYTQQDVVEEVLKKVDINQLVMQPITNTKFDLTINWSEANKTLITNFFLNKGFHLVKTYNLTTLAHNTTFNFFKVKNSVKISNPLSQKRMYLKNNLLHKHLEILDFNFRHKHKLVNFFELQALTYDQKYHHHLCISVASHHFVNKVNGAIIPNDLLFLKALINDFFTLFHQKPSFVLFPDETENSVYYRQNALQVYVANNYVGLMGQLNPQIAQNYKFYPQHQIFFCELVIDGILNYDFKHHAIILPRNYYPTITRTLSVFLTFQQIFMSLWTFLNNHPVITNVELVDVFQQEQGCVYTFVFELKCLSSKPTNDEINMLFNKIILELEAAKMQIKK